MCNRDCDNCIIDCVPEDEDEVINELEDEPQENPFLMDEENNEYLD